MSYDIAIPYEVENPYPGNGTFAYRPTGWFPGIAPENALWPPRPQWRTRFGMFVKEYWYRALRRPDAEDIRRQRTVWYRHPWLRTGEVWWRPYQSPDAHRYETFDPCSGLHRMDVEPDVEEFVFSGEHYLERAATRRWRWPKWFS